MKNPTSHWMKPVLRLAALSNIIWGFGLVLFPELDLLELSSNSGSGFFRIIGLTICMWGIGYAIASLNPLQHWGTVLVGMVVKVLTPFGLLMEAEGFSIPISYTLSIILLNYVIWWIPFGMILYRIYQMGLSRKRIVCPDVQKLALRARTTSGITLAELSSSSPILLVFSRTVFCGSFRRTIRDLASYRQQIEATGVRIVLVYMDHSPEVFACLNEVGLEMIDRVEDTRKTVYRAFGLGRANLISATILIFCWHTFKNRILRFFDSSGDWFQMPGVFLVFHGEVLRSFIHQSPTDRPDFVQLASDDPYTQTGTVV